MHKMDEKMMQLVLWMEISHILPKPENHEAIYKLEERLTTVPSS